MINIDNVEHKVNWANDFMRKFEIMNGNNSGRLQGNATMYLEYLGTFFNFEGTAIQDRSCTQEEWDNFVLTLANPINKHTVTVPFNQNSMTWEFYVSSGEQGLKLIRGTTNFWARTIKVSLVAISPQWLAGGELQGLQG